MSFRKFSDQHMPSGLLRMFSFSSDDGVLYLILSFLTNYFCGEEQVDFFFSFKSSTTMLVPQIHPSGNGSRLRTWCYVRFITDQASHTRQFSGRKFLLLPYQHLTFLLFLGLFLSFILSFITSVTLASAITFIFSSSELVVQIDIFPLDCQVFRI